MSPTDAPVPLASPRQVWLNRKHYGHCRGLYGPDGEPLKTGKFPVGLFLWTGDNRLARVDGHGVKVFTAEETKQVIQERIKQRMEEQLDKMESAQVARNRKSRWLRRNAGWLVPLVVLVPLVLLAATGCGDYNSRGAPVSDPKVTIVEPEAGVRCYLARVPWTEGVGLWCRTVQ